MFLFSFGQDWKEVLDTVATLQKQVAELQAQVAALQARIDAALNVLGR